MKTAGILGRTIALILGAVTWAFLATAALADSVKVQRPVTVREAASRKSKPVVFPEVGSTLTLLDEGRRTSGYYRVQTPDGRQGFVYYTFVRKDEGPLATKAVAPSPDDQIKVHYIDVDQGAAALVEFPCGAVMIDTGGRGAGATQHLISYLDGFFARRPDLNRRLAAVFITHTHIDHNSNLKAVAQRFRIANYIHNGEMTGSGRHAARWMVGHPPNIPAFAAMSPTIKVRGVPQRDVAGAGSSGLTDAFIDPVACPRIDPKIRVLSGRYDENPGWPDGEFDNGNNKSLVIRIDYGQASFLFTGDLEEGAIETLVERYDHNDLLDVDVYLAGHHGSYNGTTRSLLAAMTPETIVISMGRPQVQEKWTAWAYGHPRRTLVEMLAGAASGRRDEPVNVLVADKVKVFSSLRLDRAVYATGWDGDVVVTAGADGVMQVETRP